MKKSNILLYTLLLAIPIYVVMVVMLAYEEKIGIIEKEIDKSISLLPTGNASLTIDLGRLNTFEVEGINTKIVAGDKPQLIIKADSLLLHFIKLDYKSRTGTLKVSLTPQDQREYRNISPKHQSNSAKLKINAELHLPGSSPLAGLTVTRANVDTENPALMDSSILITNKTDGLINLDLSHTKNVRLQANPFSNTILQLNASNCSVDSPEKALVQLKGYTQELSYSGGNFSKLQAELLSAPKITALVDHSEANISVDSLATLVATKSAIIRYHAHKDALLTSNIEDGSSIIELASSSQ